MTMRVVHTEAQLERAQQLSGFMQRYAKQYGAGAFATPTRQEMLEHPDRIFSQDGVVWATRTLTRDSQRSDFTGRPYTFHAGMELVTHLAREEGAELPDLSRYDAIFAYAEDAQLAAQLRKQDRKPLMHRITAASEIITCWVREGWGFSPNLPHDLVTTKVIRHNVGPLVMQCMLEDLSMVDQWDDDYPYYSDGSWSAVSLRGFYPEDPRKGVKPAEMPKTWKAEHPTDLLRTCEWTSLSYQTPTITRLVENLSEYYGWRHLERVRLLRMVKGKLARHTDITDRMQGLADGQIARFHLPLVTDPNIVMTVWDLDGSCKHCHLPAGSLWYLDARKPHAVDNPTDVARVHLVMDVVSDSQLRDLVTA